jgi:hypothetical protein
MLTESRPLIASGISWAALALCLIFGGVFITSCDRPTASDATTASASPTPRSESATTGVVLRADPNPVPPGNPNGTTTVTWDTGGNDVGEVYVMDAKKEKLFATGAKGSQEAPWITPDSTEFRLYNQADHKLLAKIKVTMSPSDVSPSNLSVKPASSPTPR